MIWQTDPKQVTLPRERARETRHQRHMDTPNLTKEYKEMPIQLQKSSNPAPSTFHRENIGIQANDRPSKSEQEHTPAAMFLVPAALTQTVVHPSKTKPGVLVSM